jgi:hypothetical protein
MKTDVRTVELCMHVLPNRGHRPNGITHRSDGSSRLTITVSRGRNPIACQTLIGVWTVYDVSQILCIWTPQFTLVKPLVLLFSNVLCEF